MRISKEVSDQRGGCAYQIFTPKQIGEKAREKKQRAYDSMGLKTNVGKSKVLTIRKDQMGSCEKVRVNGEEL